MGIEEILGAHRAQVLAIVRKWGGSEVRVFGSVARGEADEHSDVDVLINLEPGRSLLDLAGLTQELERLLGRRVDVATSRGLKLRSRERILREAVSL